jgi:hypothetical protein
MWAGIHAIRAVRVHVVLQSDHLLENDSADGALEDLLFFGVHFDVTRQSRVVQETLEADITLQRL